MKINQAITATSEQLNLSNTARLDAELLVGLSTKLTRSKLYAYPNLQLTTSQLHALKQFIKRRAAGEPMAYILGQQEFWSLPFKVSPAVLIPRPETEHLVEWLIKQLPSTNQHILDLGTGSGAIACALAHEKPNWKIDAGDISNDALTIAKHNATNHQLKINFYQSDWFESLPNNHYHAIVSNPPYLANNDPHLSQLKYEPYQTALIAEDNGLAAIKHIAQHARQFLQPGGYLVIEHGYQQGEHANALLRQLNFCEVTTQRDLAGLARFVTAKYQG